MLAESNCYIQLTAVIGFPLFQECSFDSFLYAMRERSVSCVCFLSCRIN